MDSREVMQGLTALGLGGLFGLGLAISQMVNPAKVLGFLDVTGAWDPSLAFVMGGALLVTTPAFLWARGKEKAAFGEALSLPTKTRIDRPLLIGAVLFGAGWGLVGLCPGPALASIALSARETWPFVLAMVAGVVAHDLFWSQRGGSA